MPILSRFGAQPETLEDASELYQEAATATLAELETGATRSESIAVLLAHLDNDLPKVRNMLASMLARRDQWLRHVTGELRRKELEGALKHIVETNLKLVRQQFPEKHTDELLSCLRFAADNLRKEDSTSHIIKCVDIEKLPGNNSKYLPIWQGIVEFLFTGKNEWRKQANKNIGFPAAADNKAESETRKAMKDRYAALLSNLSEDEALAKQLVEVQYLPPIHYSENEWQVIEALCELLILADIQLRALAAERNQIDFTGITQAAIQALGAEETPSDLALHLDYQIKHILLDEFQDISINQYILLQQLTAGWSAEDGHSLFLVGDPMQSIYRFREAEVSIFLNTWQQQRLGQVPLIPLSITVNFRSNVGIVDWINASFEKILPDNADVSRGAVSYEHATAFHQDEQTNAVSIHPLLQSDHAIEAKRVIEIITQAKQQQPTNKIAILVRNRSHLYDIVPQLKQAGLKFQAVEIEALGQRSAIQDLLALSMALNHLADRIAWLAILRAPWCGLTLDDLILLVGKDKNKTVWECIEQNSNKLSKAGQARLSKLFKVLQQAFQEQHRRTLRRWVQSTWIRIGGPATLQEETDLENAFNFFQLLDQFDQGGDLKQREQFIEKVQTLYASPDVTADDSLQIMTIHKAKGLEFDTVILPGLSRGSATDDTQLLLWSENPHEMHQDLLLAPVKEAGQDDAPIYQYIKRLEKEKQHYEKGRLLYVAATRAKTQLHIVATVNVKEKDNELQIVPPRSNSLLAQLWPAVRENYQTAFEQEKPVQVEDPIEVKNKATQLRRLDSKWSHPEPPSAAHWQAGEGGAQTEDAHTEIEFEWAGEAIKHIGTVTHRCIQLIAEEGIDSWDETRIQSNQNIYELSLKRLGVQKEEINKACQSVIEALTKMIQDKRGQWILQKGYEIQQNEYPISGMYAGKLVNIKIDRTFVDDEGIRWVVDYKTSRHEGTDIEAFLDQEQQRYRKQLEKYGALIKSMDERPVKLGLYYPLFQGWREWEYTG